MERSGERSGTLGISYQLGSALKERHRPPVKKRASVVVPFCSSFRARRFLYSYPGFRCASSDGSWAEFFNRFAVSPTAQERSCWSKSRLADHYKNENEIPVFCSITG